MKRRLTRAIKSRCLETEIAGLRDELRLVKERQVEEIAKLVDQKAIRDAEAYRQGLLNSIERFKKIEGVITSCPPGGIFNHKNIVAFAEAGIMEAKLILESKLPLEASGT